MTSSPDADGAVPGFGPALLLASGSPQRRAILTQLGAMFRVVVPDGVEELEQGDPIALVRENARRKARAGAASAAPGELVVGVDTLVELDGHPFGKPPDVAAARDVLTRLRGRTHRVVSGLCVVDHDGDHEQVVDATTTVRFRVFSDASLDHHLAAGDWAERAGGYAIQGFGAHFVAGVEGDYLNVVGFPAAAFLDLLDARTPR